MGTGFLKCLASVLVLLLHQQGKTHSGCTAGVGNFGALKKGKWVSLFLQDHHRGKAMTLPSGVCVFQQETWILWVSKKQAVEARRWEDHTQKVVQYLYQLCKMLPEEKWQLHASELCQFLWLKQVVFIISLEETLWKTQWKTLQKRSFPLAESYNCDTYNSWLSQCWKCYKKIREKGNSHSRAASDRWQQCWER